MTTFVNATYYPDERIAEYVTAEGRRLMRRGGSLCWLLNNCGNLVAPMKDGKPAPKKTKNYVGFARAGTAGHHFFIFKSYEAGRDEVKAWFKRRGTLSIAKCIEAYAPPHENNTTKYVADIESLSGITSTREIASLSATDLDKLVDAMERKEGYHQNANTRQEKWVDATIITVTNGSAPIAGFELQLERAGKTQTIKANEFGQFRPIPHIGKTPTIIKAPKTDGSWEKLLELTEKTKTHIFSLIVDWFSVTATMQSTQAPSQAKRKKNPIQYRVQPGDNLSKIAKNFHTDMTELKTNNQLKGDAIFPEQVLWIYGKGTDLGPKVPKPMLPNKAKPAKAPAASAPKATTLPDTAPVVRGQQGEGKPLALITAQSGRAPWMAVAVREAQKWAGHYESVVAEKKAILKGKGSKGLIATNYHAETGVVIDQDTPTLTTAWCASFVNYCLKEARFPYSKNPSSQFPVNDPRRFVKIDKPVYGALVVYKHTKKGIGMGHVAFIYHRIDKFDGRENYAVLGGNQGDQITLQDHERVYLGSLEARLVGFFVPLSYFEYAKKMMSESSDLGEEIKLKELKESTGFSINNSTNTR
jgi:uncharacterized protein (TIGR02594 family)